jgi:hypothetical protein
MNFPAWAQIVVLALQTVVLGLTAYWVWRYTKATERYGEETSRLTHEMVRQNEIALRPVVVPIFEENQGHFLLKLQNIGIGCALNVRVCPIPHEFGVPNHPIHHETRFGPIGYIAQGQIEKVELKEYSEGSPTTKNFLENKFFPGRVTSTTTMTLLYDDVEGGAYELPVVVEPPLASGFAAPALQLNAWPNFRLGGIRRHARELGVWRMDRDFLRWVLREMQKPGPCHALFVIDSPAAAGARNSAER